MTAGTGVLRGRGDAWVGPGPRRWQQPVHKPRYGCGELWHRVRARCSWQCRAPAAGPANALLSSEVPQTTKKSQEEGAEP